MNATSARTSGTLFIVATPIGNREDISLRAIATLENVDAILAEDTRHSKHLLSTYGIHKPMLSFHAHNEAQKAKEIIHALQQGQSFALITDAGTPLISDPGYPLVHLARSEGIQVTPIPGACAFIAALSAAGVPCDQFSFLGFLPAKQTARQAKLKTIQSHDHTVIFYESTHRIHATLDDIAMVLGHEKTMVLVKELTKTFEQFISASAPEIRQWLDNEPGREKGEFILIIPPSDHASADTSIDSSALLQLLLEELSVKQAVKIATKITGQPKNELYKMAIMLEHNQENTSK